MKRLYVGCRVRIVYSEGGGLLGAETRIVEWEPHSRDVDGDYSGWRVEAVNKWGFQAVCKPEWLEPIIDPDLNKVITWADMADLWTPSGVEA